VSDRWTEHPGDFPPASAAHPGNFGSRDAPTLATPPTWGAGPPLPPMPVPRTPSADRNLIIAVSVLAAIFLVAIVSVLFISRQDDNVATGPGTSASTRPSSTSTTAPIGITPSTQLGPGGTTSPTTLEPVLPPVTRPGGVAPTLEQVEEAVLEISAFVEKERGLTFKTRVEIDLVTDTDFAEQLTAELDERKDERVKTGRILAALGLVDRRLDYDGTVRTLQSIGVVTYYDVTRRVLVVRAVQLTPYVKASLARELTRALDDAYFDLNRPEYREQQDEIGFGFQAVIEGDVRRIESAYIKTMSSPDQAQRSREESQFAADNPAPNVPAIVFEVVQAPEDLGVPFVQRVIEHGGNDELATVFTEPPRMSAQVLHADRYFAHDERVPVDKPDADGEQFAEGVFGEEMTRLMLANDADQSEADVAAEGWAGDWYVAWDDGAGGSCIRIHFRMKTTQDLTELEEALAKWVQAGGGRGTVERGDEDSEIIELTSCSSAGGGGQSPA